MSTPAFDLLARPIQQVLWDLGWQALRPIQVDAISEVLETDHHLLISARTASGKTEAAFLPILSDLYSKPPQSIGAIYVGPLKALINDQFRRLDVLCERAEIPVHRWHGDVDAGKKAKLTTDPRGVLLVTPESIESLFVNRSRFLESMFQELRYVVIDEIHALVGRERGLQLRSLLCRLRRFTKQPFRIAGLSATVGNAIDDYRRWIAPDAIESVRHISDPGEKKRVLFRIQSFLKSKPREGTGAKPKELEEGDAETPPGLIANIIEHFAGKKNLIFCNRREQVEVLADDLNAECRRIGRAQEFWVHHGSLSKENREDTELEMRGMRPATTLCSSTLELGIDIGNVITVGQIGPTWSVNSLVQRLGRSGRKDAEPHCMRVMLVEPKSDANSDLIDQLHLPLLQAIAAAELMRERWVEPPGNSSMDLSTLTQQILSCLAETGGTKADQLFRRLVCEGAFRHLDSDLFGQVLRSLGQAKLIEQAPDKTLILAPDGERVVHDLDFYSAFTSGLEFAVRHDGRLIGTLPAINLPQLGDHLVLGGRRWQVEAIDVKRVEILVRPALGRKPPRFLGSGGEVHRHVREKMREVLLGDSSFEYLDDISNEFLAEARLMASRAKLANTSVINIGSRKILWFTWTGSKTQTTLRWLLEYLGVTATGHDVAMELGVSPSELAEKLQPVAAGRFTAEDLACSSTVRELRKFDRFLNENLLIQALATDHIDLEGASAIVRSVLAELGQAGYLPSSSENKMSPNAGSLLDAVEYASDLFDKAIESSVPSLFVSDAATRFPVETALQSVEFVAFDLETTGLHPVVDKIVEIAAVRFRLDGTEVGHFHRLVNPDRDIPECATEIHGIRYEDVMGAPRIDKVLPQFMDFVGDSSALLVAHNAAFDVGFLSMALTSSRIPPPRHAVLDSLDLSQILLPGQANYRLETIAQRMGISSLVLHRAKADTATLRQVVTNLLQSVPTIGRLFAVTQPLAFFDFAVPNDKLPQTLGDLPIAIESRLPVMMVYGGGTRSESLRTVTPLAVVEYGQRQYLQAECHLAQAVRTFRIDRIRTLRITTK